MSRRAVAAFIAVAGVVAIALAALGPDVGIGHPGLGVKKEALLAFGILLVIVGAAMALLSMRSSEPPEDMHHLRH